MLSIRNGFSIGHRVLPASRFRLRTQLLRSFAVEEAGKTKTYYDILDITRKAKPDEVKAAYRRMAKRFHPDHNVDNPDAENQFKEVQEAHATLSDPWKRALYDQDLQFGSMAIQEGGQETWEEAWARETPEERQARLERYRRYARGERNDIPPAPFPLRLTLPIIGVILGGVAYTCVKAPEWIDHASDLGYCDPAYNDRSVPLVRAFHDPVMNRWERLSDGTEPPTPKELYAHYKRSKPLLMEDVDFKLLPKVALTVLQVPRTDTVKGSFSVQLAKH